MNTLTIFSINQAVNRNWGMYESEWLPIVEAAAKAGYIIRLSHTQAQWTDEGLEKARRELQDGTPLLEHLTQSAIWAHNWTSFDPDKRGRQFVNDYSQQLSEDLATLEGYGATQEQKDRYKAGYEKMLRAWIGAKSNCASSAITGGSGFNVRRAEKMNGREEAHGKAFFAWRDKVLNAWRRESDRRKKEAVINAAGGEAALMRQRIAEAKAYHEKCKAGNREIAKAKKEGRDISEWLKTEFDIPGHMIDWAMKFGVTSSTATANIRRMEDRVKELEAKEARQAEGGEAKRIEGEGWAVVQNNECDRIQILFDSKPDEQTRSLLRSKAFKWAPSQNAWQRQITGNAIHAANQIIQELKKATAS
jgi:hypothetical protein